MGEVGYLYFSRKDYDFIAKHFPNLHASFEQFVSGRHPEVELQVTDDQTEILDNKVLMTIGDSATSPQGNPSREAIKLEQIWDTA